MVGGAEDIAGGTVILLQPDGDGVGILLFKGKNVFNGSPAELIDALVIVAHHAEIAPAAGQQRAEHILGVVGVLIFVHQHIAELVLVIFPHIVLGLEQLHRWGCEGIITNYPGVASGWLRAQGE